MGKTKTPNANNASPKGIIMTSVKNAFQGASLVENVSEKKPRRSVNSAPKRYVISGNVYNRSAKKYCFKGEIIIDVITNINPIMPKRLSNEKKPKIRPIIKAVTRDFRVLKRYKVITIKGDR